MHRLLLTYIVICSSLLSVQGQYYQYSQYNYAQQRVNPAAISLSDYATAGFIYRSQMSVSDVKLNSMLFSAKAPIIAKNGGKRWSSVGITLSDDKAGLEGIFETNEIGVTYAVNFPTGKLKTLSIGGKFNYQSRKINSENLYTGSQFVEGQGFVLELNPGEDLGKYNTNFVSVSAGAIWQQENRFEQRKIHFGASIFDLNQPNESLLGGESSLPATMVFEGGYRAYDNSLISVYPEFLYTRSRFTSALSVGAITTYKLDRYNPGLQGQTIEFHSKYLLNQGFMIGAQWKKGSLSLGTSFDIPVNSRIAHQGAFEIGFELGKLVESKYKTKKRKKPKGKNISSKRISNISNNIKRNQKSNRPKEVHVSTDEIEKDKNDPEEDSNPEEEQHVGESERSEGVASFGNLQYEPFELEQTKLTYNFDFDSSNPRYKAEDYITDLLETVQKDAIVKIEITGHTDNVGSKEYNRVLSIKRAKVFYDILLEHGIDKKIITYSGKGESKPLNNNSTPELRNGNRRVDIIFFY